MVIKLKNDSGKEQMQFINCIADMPRKGLSFVPSGCGSGKSTIISDIIKNHGTEGILVVCPTIDAIKELEQRVRNYTTIGYLYTMSSDKAVMNDYRDDPDKLQNYGVLVITAARIQIDPYNIFLKYKGGTRKYVLIDEMINFYPPSFQISKPIENVVSYVDKNSKKPVVTLDNGFYQHTYKTKEEMMAAYKVSGLKLFGKAHNKLTEMKLDFMFNHILKNGFSPIKNKIQDFADHTITILFDGTVDCLAKSKDTRLVKVQGYKYDSDIKFQDFPIGMKRRNNEDWTIQDLKTKCQAAINLIKRICQTRRLLIVTWKTIDSRASKKSNTGIADNYEVDPTTTQYKFPEIFKLCLLNEGIPEDRFSIIYRGSGQDRGSNQYRDYESVMFFGEWHVPGDVVKDINSMFGLRADYDGYVLSLLIQTICRCRIRQHQGLPIEVYYSNDISRKKMYAVQEYFKNNSSPKCMISGVPNFIHPKGRTDKKFIFDLILLYSYDTKIRDSIENNTPYSFDITLDELYKLVKKKRKAKDRYKSFIKYLKGKKITMRII